MVTNENRYGPCASCGEPTYGLRHARCEAERDARLPGDVTYPDGWPSCGHSHCRQNWIDTGAHDVCVERAEDEIPAAERCGECGIREAHYTGGPCTYCWHTHYDREDY